MKHRFMGGVLSFSARIGTMNLCGELVARASRQVRQRGRDARATTWRFMGSPLSAFFRMHWDREPTPNPSQEGNRQDADQCLLASWEGSGVSRFIESADAFFAGWDDESCEGKGGSA